MGTHPIFESDFDCLTEHAPSSRLPHRPSPAAKCIESAGRCPPVPSFLLRQYDVGPKYMMGWFLGIGLFCAHLAYNELTILHAWVSAIEKAKDKYTSEPRGLHMCDAVIRQKLAAQDAIWAAEDEEDEE